MKLVQVTSPNGLGHARRQMHLLTELAKDHEVSFVASAKNLAALRGEFDELGSNNVSLFEVSNIGIDRVLMSPRVTQFAHHIDEAVMSALDSADAVISDNSLWPATYSTKVFLMGHFLWTDFYQEWPLRPQSDEFEKAMEYERGLVPQIRAWFNTAGFSIIRDGVGPELIEVPLLRYTNDYVSSSPYSSNGEIWVSRGTTGLLENSEFRGSPFVEKESFWLRKGEKPHLIVGRAGLGTIRDCLSHAVPFISLGSDRNPELSNNYKVYKELLALAGVDMALFQPGTFYDLLSRDYTSVRRASMEVWSEISATALEVSSKVLAEMSVRL